MMRSQSLPFELSSLSMRSAKLVHGTNSNFIFTPLLAVKSLESSTSAFAGSQAAQHNVMVLSCASAVPHDAARAMAAAREAAPGSVFIFTIDFMSCLQQWVQGPYPTPSVEVLGRQDLDARL